MQELNCDQAKEYVDNIGPCQWIRASVSPYEENAQDKQLDESLQDFIKEASPLADDEERERREMTLESLTQIWKAWVYETCIAKGKPPEIARAAGGTVLTSGSFKLGVEARGTDIDAICVAPMYITREDFFGSLADKLKAHPKVTNFNGIPDARVPILTFHFDEVDIDFLLAVLNLPSVPNDLNVDDDKYLVGVDEATQITLNGPRCTNLQIQLMLSTNNYEAFLVTLRVVRYWAKRRGLYSNKQSYLGGINWAMLCAFVCQLYPKMPAGCLLRMFFLLLDTWQWPTPIKLCDSYKNIDLNLEIWDPDGKGRRDLMPILTPAYPSANSTYSVNDCTLKVMKEEFKRGRDIMSSWGDSLPTSEQWENLFEPADFFINRDFYVMMEVFSESALDQNAWKGFFEARIRKLVEKFSYLPLRRICNWPLQMPGSMGEHSCTYYMGFDINKKDARSKKLDITREVDYFRQGILGKFDKKKDTMNVNMTAFRWKGLHTHENTGDCFDKYGGKEGAKVAREQLLQQRKEEAAKRQVERLEDAKQTAAAAQELIAKKKAELEALKEEVLAKEEGEGAVKKEDPGVDPEAEALQKSLLAEEMRKKEEEEKANAKRKAADLQDIDAYNNKATETTAIGESKRLEEGAQKKKKKGKKKKMKISFLKK